MRSNRRDFLWARLGRWLLIPETRFSQSRPEESQTKLELWEGRPFNFVVSFFHIKFESEELVFLILFSLYHMEGSWLMSNYGIIMYRSAWEESRLNWADNSLQNRRYSVYHHFKITYEHHHYTHTSTVNLLMCMWSVTVVMMLVCDEMLGGNAIVWSA